jgi:AAA domain
MVCAPDPSSILAALAEARARGFEPVAIVIDTVFRSFGSGNVNASPDMNAYLACIAVLTDAGHVVGLVHHEIKSGGTPAGSAP